MKKQTSSLGKTSKMILNMVLGTALLIAVGYFLGDIFSVSHLSLSGMGLSVSTASAAASGGGSIATVMLAGAAIPRAGIVDATRVDASHAAPANVRIPGGEHEYVDSQTFNDVNEYIIPPTVNVTIKSNITAGAAVDTTVTIFNSATFGSIANNGDGAGTITYTWSDGAAGLLINNILTNARFGVGQVIHGFSICCTLKSTGADNIDALDAANPTWMHGNGQGTFKPYPVSTAANQTRNDNNKTITVIVQKKNITNAVKHQLTIKPNTIMSLCYYTHPNFKV